MIIPFEWENVKSLCLQNNGTATIRAKVFGGWMVRHLSYDNTHQQQSESSIFVPDPNHEWEVI